MAPRPEEQTTRESWVLYDTDISTDDKAPVTPVPPSADERKWNIVWPNVVIYVLNHITGAYGAYLFFTTAMWRTCTLAYFMYIFSGLGLTAGAHRLWSHKAYKAVLPVQALLMIFNTIAFQNSIIHWARDHRMHHKYSETDADPHNATRGFFFSHVGWMLVRKHPQIKAAAPTIDIKDLWADPVLKFQKRWYLLLVLIFCFVLPVWIPTLWGESLWNSFFVNQCRYVYVLNISWFVNSAAHMWGNKPYDKSIKPVEVPVLSPLVLGEGFHNYHHTFPWDYKSSELGGYALNVTTLFLDVLAKLGLVFEMKTISNEVVVKRARRTGDGSHPAWGWDDKDVLQEHRDATNILNKMKSKAI